MTAIPQAYLDTILPLIGKARDFLEHGETLAPIAFVGNFATQQTTPVLIDSRDDDAKERSAQAVKHTAENLAADFVFMIMEAWSLQKDKLHRREEIMERYLTDAEMLEAGFDPNVGQRRYDEFGLHFGKRKPTR